MNLEEIKNKLNLINKIVNYSYKEENINKEIDLSNRKLKFYGDGKNKIGSELDLKHVIDVSKVVYNYPDEIFHLIDILDDLNLLNKDYIVYFNDVKRKKIIDLTKEEIGIYLTAIIRGERFCDGHIAFYIKNGFLKELIDRLISLL